MKQEVQVLLYASQITSDPLENINKVIEIMKPDEIILNNNVCQSTISYVLEKIQKCTDIELKNKYIEKLNELLLICLTKYYKNAQHIDGIAANKTFLITYNMLDQGRIFEIIKILNTCTIKNNVQTAHEILYTTIPLLYKYYYQTYTWNYKYQDYEGNSSKDRYIKLPKTTNKNELKQLISLARKDTDFNLIEYNYRYNNYAGKGSGKNAMPNIEYAMVKQLPKIEMATKTYVPMKLNENFNDTYIDFADISSKTKLNGNFETFVSMQLMQSETSAKRYLMYLLNDQQSTEIFKEDVCVLLAQLYHHLDKLVNMDGFQHSSRKSRTIKFLLNVIKINDYPNLSFVLKNSKMTVKEYILKQLHYKVLKIKLLNNMKIKYYLPFADRNCDLLENGEIVEVKGDFHSIKFPYRHLTKSQRTNTLHKKTEQLVSLDYYPKVLITVVKKDGKFVYKYNTTFTSGYKRAYKKTKLIKKSKVPHVDPVHESNLKFNKIFNPKTKKKKSVFHEDVIISRNLFMTKILLKFLCVDRDGKLLISLDKPEDIGFLNEVIVLLEMIYKDPIFDKVNLKFNSPGNGMSKKDVQLEKLQNLLMQFLEHSEN